MEFLKFAPLPGVSVICTDLYVSPWRVSQQFAFFLFTSPDTHLGGEDFDQRLMDYCISQFKRQSGIDVSDDKRAVQRLRRQCEMAKRTLSTQTSASIDCDALANGLDFTTTISRAKFEELNLDLFKKTMIPVTQVLKDAAMSKSDVDQIILVGGSTRIPKVQQMLTEYFGGKELNKGINPDEAVVSQLLITFVCDELMTKKRNAWLLYAIPKADVVTGQIPSGIS